MINSSPGKSYRVLGLMSGTSLDGMDMAVCLFKKKNGNWKYIIESACTVAYPVRIEKQLKRAMEMSAQELVQLHASLAKHSAVEVLSFLKKISKKPTFISSHGHTVFHRPDLGYTFQAGSGAVLASHTGLPVVCDFRSTDVALGGQGAPLVPMGDALLFKKYEACVNLGGIANLSFQVPGQGRMAFDVCAGNQLLNLLASRRGLAYDEGGKLAAKGKFLPEIFRKLNAPAFFRKPGPKSLGKEWVDRYAIPAISAKGLRTEDLLHTVCHHIAYQLSIALQGKKKILVTGGGALNTFLLNTLEEYCGHPIPLADEQTIQFKEALIFAFLGVLRMQEKVNVKKEYTGALRDSISGAVYLP